MLRIRTDFLWPVVRFEYMMMAPYQNFSKYNEEFVVRGLRQGEWEVIDLSPYFPVLLGERSIRERNLYAGRSFDWDRRREYVAMAERILQLEEARGRSYRKLVMEWWRWPASPAGYDALKKREFADVELLLRYP